MHTARSSVAALSKTTASLIKPVLLSRTARSQLSVLSDRTTSFADIGARKDSDSFVSSGALTCPGSLVSTVLFSDHDSFIDYGAISWLRLVLVTRFFSKVTARSLLTVLFVGGGSFNLDGSLHYNDSLIRHGSLQRL